MPEHPFWKGSRSALINCVSLQTPPPPPFFLEASQKFSPCQTAAAKGVLELLLID